MSWLAVLAGLVMQPAEPAPAITPRIVDWAAVGECTTGLQNQYVDQTVRVQCDLDDHGAPQDCDAVDREGLPNSHRRAARCMAANFRAYDADGAMVTGQTIVIPVRLRMNLDRAPAQR